MLTWNSAESIRTALESVEGLVDAILINDAFSTDQTLAIAEEFGAEIYQRKFSGPFADERNFLLDRSKSKWVFILDSDEFLSKEIRSNFKTHLEILERDNYEIGCYSRKNFIDGNLHQVEVPGHARFLQRDKVRYIGRVHEQLVSFGRIFYFKDYFVCHYKSRQKQQEQTLRYEKLI